MNILMIHCHDMGRANEIYDPAFPSPNMRALAELPGTTTFTGASACAPTCSPSRAAMFSGYYPHEVHMTGLAHRGFTFGPAEKHLSFLLKNRGYETVLAGIQHEVSDWEGLGYDRYLGGAPEAPYQGGFDPLAWEEENTRQTIAYLNDRALHNGSIRQEGCKPFFLFWGLFNPHRPFPESAEPQVDKGGAVPEGLPETPPVRGDSDAYRSGLRFADKQIGRVRQVLEESGLLEETLLILTTDHGIAFPGHKCTLSERGIGVTLVVRPPASLPGGGEDTDLPHPPPCGTPVSHLDIVPTVLDYIGGEEPGYSGDGISLRPLLEAAPRGRGRGAETPFLSRCQFSEISYHAAYEPCRGIRKGRYKFVRYFEEPILVPSNVDDSATKKEVRTHFPDHRFLKVDARQLYDLESDPREEQNLIGMVGTMKISEELGRDLELWMMRTDDPLLYGKVKVPSGAVVDHRDAESPSG